MAESSVSSIGSPFADWLISIKLDHYTEAFEELGFDGVDILSTLPGPELQDMMNLLAETADMNSEDANILLRELDVLRKKRAGKITTPLRSKHETSSPKLIKRPVRPVADDKETGMCHMCLVM